VLCISLLMPKAVSTTDNRDSWPEFLNLLESDPKGALDGFYRLACNSIGSVPPRPVRGLSKQDFEDFFHDFVGVCCEKRFRKLRKYANRGRPFAGWLYVVAHNYALDWIAKTGRPREVPGDYESEVNPDTGLSTLVDTVREAMRTLSEKCRLLLKLAAEEYTPKEMALAMGWSASDNAKASDDLRFCRRKLREVLTQSGVDVDAELRIK